MVAVYPAAVKTFAYRQDYTELVEAADVNVSYDEIAATQTILGVNPNKDTIDGAVNSWSTVGSRISAVRAGVSKPFCNVTASNVLVHYNVPLHPSFTSKTMDSHKMWNGGTNLICPRSGIYTFDFYVRWHKDGMSADNQQPVFNRNGKLEISLQPVNGNAYTMAQTGYFPTGYQKATRQSCSITMPWTKGVPVFTTLYQDVITTPTIIATAICSITYQRDPQTTNNL